MIIVWQTIGNGEAQVAIANSSSTIASEMWPPADSRQIPSREEVERVKCEIYDLEGELERVPQLAIQLATSLRERKEWIAPIKMLPSDLLSDIFIICSNERNFAPVRISAVCHRWREVVLATPLAWSSINTWDRLPVGYLDMFMERSSPCLLHLELRHVDKNGRPWNDIDRIVDLHDDIYIYARILIA
jgi:hypothetical protein